MIANINKLIILICGLSGLGTMALPEKATRFGNLRCLDSLKTKTVYLPPEIPIHFAYIPAGEFDMGSPESEQDRQKDEGPQRRVKLSKGFYMGIYEVTQAQWVAVMGKNPSIFQDKPDYRQYPVDMVSWKDCMKFIKKLNKMGLGRFRMPTEAEWEYACKAGTSSRFYWGDELNYEVIGKQAWFYSRAEGKSHPVGEKEPNAWGLYDMAGNVWEWCTDWKGPYPVQAETDPVGPATGTDKIFRGGSWFNKHKTLRSSNRNAHPPGIPYTNIGLRLVLEEE